MLPYCADVVVAAGPAVFSVDDGDAGEGDEHSVEWRHLRRMMPRYAMPCHVMLCCAVLCCDVLCCTVLCYTVLCNAMLCYAIEAAIVNQTLVVGMATAS